jgi:DNA polymerase-4
MFESMLRQRAEDYRTVYIDMDSFFASAEQQRRPELKGRAVGVCPHISEGGCIVAASREAKRLGVKTGMRVRDAQAIAPDIVLVRDTPAYYRAIHAQVLRILEATPCRLDVRGIDEMRLVVPSYMRNELAVEQLIRGIKAALRAQLGDTLTASLGVGANGWQAKMASAFRKPDGQFVLRQDELAEFYRQIKLIDCTGIRHRLSRRLYQMGIFSPLDLYSAPEPLLRQQLGVNGTKWYLRLRGVEVDERAERPKQSIGHQTTLMPRAAETPAQLMSVVVKMMLKVGYRLRASQRQARAMAISVRFMESGWWGDVARHLDPISSHRELVRTAEGLLRPLTTQFRSVKKVSIVTFDLVAAQQQSWLRDRDLRGEYLSEALDELRRRFGARAIGPASALSDEVFPDRIGFGAPEKLLLPDIE